jgi:hypothetical protein
VENAHALVIGIAAYEQVAALPAAVRNDAHDLRDMLVAPDRCAYDETRVRLLVDAEATREAVVGRLAELAERANADSVVFVSFSGHGGRIESGPFAGEYLLPVDVRGASDNEVAGTALSGAEVANALATIPARKLVVVLDCCHAAGLGRAKAALPTLRPGLPESYYEQLHAGRGRVVLASSRSDEYSWVLDGRENSLFTAHLLAGLGGEVASDDGFVRIFDLFEYVQPRVVAAQPQQHPLFRGELEENFPIALYRGGERGVVERDGEGFRFDAYVSFADADADWVWQTLVPRLEAAGLRVAVSGDVEEPGVARVVNVERGLETAKRTVAVLSPAYLADRWSEFENTLVQTIGIDEGTYRLLPLKIAPLDTLPARLRMLSAIDLSGTRPVERELGRLMTALEAPLPRTSSS